MKKAFSLIEILIVVAVLGILAAIVLPTFQDQALQGKEAAAKDNLRILRNAIELYASRHDDVAPGYSNNDPSTSVTSRVFKGQLVGSYFSVCPKNSFNNSESFWIVQDSDDFPTEALNTGELTFGWVYKAATKTVQLNWPGTDSAGVRYFDY